MCIVRRKVRAQEATRGTDGTVQAFSDPSLLLIMVGGGELTAEVTQPRQRSGALSCAAFPTPDPDAGRISSRALVHPTVGLWRFLGGLRSMRLWHVDVQC